jgi:hypothetical protein
MRIYLTDFNAFHEDEFCRQRAINALICARDTPDWRIGLKYPFSLTRFYLT